jgi:hypothetical protein
VAKKKAKGRPKKPGEWKKVLTTIEANLLDWLDERAERAGCTRSEFVTLLLSGMQQLYQSGHVRFGPGTFFWFRGIVDYEIVREQVESGFWPKSNEDRKDYFPIGVFLTPGGNIEDIPRRPPPDDRPSLLDGPGP